MPYSWDDTNDYEKDSQKGYTFQDAKKAYKSKATPSQTPSQPATRSYSSVGSEKSQRTKAFYTYKSPFLKTDAEYPIMIGIDTTGSMAEWPGIFFDKLPLLYKEAVKYFPDCEISFQAINDFHADGANNALQPAPFGKGAQLDELIKQLYPVGGGGGNGGESYEIFAAYNSFIQAPKAKVKPIAIILGDEPLFIDVPNPVIKQYRLNAEKKEVVNTKYVFKKLHEKCDVFLVRKPYNGMGQDSSIIEVWETIGLMPSERIINIEDPKRVVDVILGILGILTGKTEFFEKELIERQDKNQVKDVLQSLHLLKSNFLQNSMSQGLSGDKSKGLEIDE